MSSNKVQLNRSSRSREDLSSQTITTARCIDLQPVLVYEVVPKSTFKVHGEKINRVDALPVSAFCSFKNRDAAFYVHNSQIWKPYDSFKSGAPYAFGYVNSVPTKKPYLSSFDLFVIFVANNQASSNSLQLVTRTDVTTAMQGDINNLEREIFESHTYDFGMKDSQSLYGYVLTTRGVLFYKKLISLGYRIPKIIDLTQSVDKYIQQEQSLLTLMAYLSIIVNYYIPLKYKSFAFVNSLSYLIDPVPQHWVSLAALTTDMRSFIGSVIDIISQIYYGDDYFTSALVNPFLTPTGKVYDSLLDPSAPNWDSAVRANRLNVNDATPNVETDPDDTGTDHITQYLLYALQVYTGQAQLSALTLNDVGAATLAKFGYKAECADMVPYLLGKIDSRINVAPEVSTADTRHEDPVSGEEVGMPIGFKAGKAEGYSKINGTYKFDQYGVFIVVDSIMPDYFYYKGIRRSLLRVNQEDEYDKNYVRQGIQAIGTLELDVDNIRPMNRWGFCRKYGDMAQGNNILSGDFIVNTQNVGMDSFHFGRECNRVVENTKAFAMAVDSVTLLRSPLDGTQFNRVFVQSLSDPIQQWYIWKVDAWLPIASDMTIGENDGEVIETKPLGQTLNN